MRMTLVENGKSIGMLWQYMYETGEFRVTPTVVGLSPAYIAENALGFSQDAAYVLSYEEAFAQGLIGHVEVRMVPTVRYDGGGRPI